MCKCVLPPGVNPIAVDRYINIIINKLAIWRVRVIILLLRLERTWKEASSDASVKVLFQPEFVPFAD
jgi:hypothetical protein